MKFKKKIMKKKVMGIVLIGVISGICGGWGQAYGDVKEIVNEDVKEIINDDSINIDFEKFLKENSDMILDEKILGKDTKAGDLKIINKDLKWASELDYSNKPNRLILHHIEASKENGNIRIEEVHEWHKNNGWAGIGYHFYINKKGEIYRGREENVIGAHAYKHNVDSLGIAVEGKYEFEQMPKVQKDAVEKLGKYLRQKYKIETIQKHGDVVATNCPGNNYPFTDIVNEIKKEKLKENGIVQWIKEKNRLFFKDEWLNEKLEGEIIYNKKKYQSSKEQGILKQGLITLDSKTFFIKDDYYLAVGWEQSEGNWYYFNENNEMTTGWKMLPDFNWYYFRSDGSMVNGWEKMPDGNWYHFDESGVMAIGWKKLSDGNWYYFNESGVMLTEWQRLSDGEWYYFNGSGVMLTGWNKLLDNNWYYFNKSGVMLSNIEIDGVYIDTSGKAILK